MNVAFQITVCNCHERIADDRENLSFLRDTRSLFENSRLFLDPLIRHWTFDTNTDLKNINSNNSKKNLLGLRFIA